jgi:hypothetical protein
MIRWTFALHRAAAVFDPMLTTPKTTARFYDLDAYERS